MFIVMRSAIFQSFRVRAGAGALAFLVLLAGCGNKNGASPQGGAGAKPPPIEVGVASASLQPVALQTELPGRVDPLRVAQVRARVNGVVLQRLFREGSEVKEGQLLYQIDPGPYRPRAGNRSRAGECDRSDPTGLDPANQKCLCQFHPIGQRSDAPA